MFKKQACEFYFPLRQLSSDSNKDAILLEEGNKRWCLSLGERFFSVIDYDKNFVYKVQAQTWHRWMMTTPSPPQLLRVQDDTSVTCVVNTVAAVVSWWPTLRSIKSQDFLCTSIWWMGRWRAWHIQDRLVVLTIRMHAFTKAQTTVKITLCQFECNLCFTLFYVPRWHTSWNRDDEELCLDNKNLNLMKSLTQPATLRDPMMQTQAPTLVTSTNPEWSKVKML